MKKLFTVSICMLFISLAFAAGPVFAEDSSAPPAAADRAPAQGSPVPLFLDDDVIFDNGGVPNDANGNEMTRWLQTEDFVLDDDYDVTDAHIVLFEFDAAAWDETLEYFFFEDNAGEPGAMITSGQMTDAVLVDLGPGTFGPRTSVSFDLEEPLSLTEGSTYWFGVHANGDYATRDNVYWETGSEGFGSTGVESIGGTLDNWSNNGQHHWFLLTGVPTAIEVAIDIKFCSDPNAFNCKKKGVLPVTIFGTEDFNVEDIDISSLELCTEDLLNCTNAPRDWSYADRGNPDTDLGAAMCAIVEVDEDVFEEQDYLNQDGWLDLDAAFEASEVQDMLGTFCSDVKGATSEPLVITGTTLDGTMIFSVPVPNVGTDQLWKANK